MLLGPDSSNAVFNSERLVSFIVFKIGTDPTRKKNYMLWHFDLVIRMKMVFNGLFAVWAPNSLVFGVVKLEISNENYILWKSHYSCKRPYWGRKPNWLALLPV